MKLVIDTNVLLVSISRKSKFHWLFEKLVEGAFTLCITTEILAEYAEIVGQHMGRNAQESSLGFIENLSNVEFITTYFKFGLLNDEDDNKFVDCAIASNADFIVSHDTDFKNLTNIPFPKVNVISMNKLEELLNKK